MSVLLKSRLTDPSAWKGADFNEDKSWVYTLTSEDIESLDRALDHANHHVIFPFLP